MPRLFTALEVPPDVAERLSHLRGGLPGARWVEPENYHVTLRFLGDVDARTARDATEFLRGSGRAPVMVELTGLDVFGGSRPRALIARVTPNAALLELQAEHERLVRRAGLAPETRKYAPHVTLARLRNVSSRDAADWLAQRGGPLGLQYEVERAVMFSSRASTGGGPYIAEQVFPFGAFGENDEGDAEFEN